MIATIAYPEPRQATATVPSVRLALKARSVGKGLLDGAWWPRSRDLSRELPALTEVLDPLWGRITHIAVNPARWPLIPRRVPVHGHVVKVGWFRAELDPHKILLLSYNSGRWDLLVVPPHTGAAAAARLMAAASDVAGPFRTASALVAAEEAAYGTLGAGWQQDPEEGWEGEGGARPATVAVPGCPDCPGGRSASGRGALALQARIKKADLELMTVTIEAMRGIHAEKTDP
ncbi:DUF5994 family protein [Streptomyces sp. NPDC021093]|uniref:DUF5994 family protein n=1 Tax=Streptomyces sp. NPDC021093 TaxID=3365112 RepID=UPI00379CB8D9